MPNIKGIFTAHRMQKILNCISIAEALMGTTVETLIMKEVHGVTLQILRPAGSTAACLVVEINLDLVCFEELITKNILHSYLIFASYTPSTDKRALSNVNI